MPRLTSAIPRLCVHKPSDRACVYLDGRRVYLGKAGSPESRQAYAALLTKLASGEPTQQAAAVPSAPSQPTINQLLFRYFTEQLPRYVEHEQRCQKGAIRILRQFFGDTPVADFGPLRLRAVINSMIAGDPHGVDADGNSKPRKPWTRGFVNRQVKRIRQIFKWAVGWELCPQVVADALRAVGSIKPGESDAKDNQSRRAVPDSDLLAVRAKLRERHQDVFDLLLMTGARPGELFGLTTDNIDRSGEVWRAEIVNHKTRHHGKARTLFFNGSAQANWLDGKMGRQPDNSRYHPGNHSLLHRAVSAGSLFAACASTG